MSGLVGYVGKRPAASFILEGLRRLEFRGYDSAGVAFDQGGSLSIRKGVGKLSSMSEQLLAAGGKAQKGIGHTRWATHGIPSEANAHPHRDCSGTVAVVHNGIIENHHTLRDAMQAQGCRFTSETDSEVVAHLIEHELKRNGGNLEKAVKEALRRIEGSFAIAAMAAHDTARLVAARRGSPLIVGIGDGERLLASDVPALLPFTRDQLVVGEGEVAVITHSSVEITELLNGRRVPRRPTRVAVDVEEAERGGFPHFMLKEIHEQPQAIADTLRGRLGASGGVEAEFGLDIEIARSLKRVDLVGCGTSWHAALIGRRLLEEFAGIPASAEIASEYRFRPRPTEEGTLALAISQSGETADTIGALRGAKEAGARTAAIANVVDSTLAREADGILYTRAGAEVSIASTKAFTCQVAALFLLALTLGRLRGRLDPASAGRLSEALLKAPEKIAGIIHRTQREVEPVANAHFKAQDYLYLGRGYNFPLALEGALKLKEVSYAHAEGYPAGELKHGPIALIGKGVPVMAIATRDPLRDKVLSSIQEVKAREGVAIAIGTEGDDELVRLADHTILLPHCEESIAPLYASVPLQLYAYYVALARGCNVDKPRNLTKAVTVE